MKPGKADRARLQRKRNVRKKRKNPGAGVFGGIANPMNDPSMTGFLETLLFAGMAQIVKDVMFPNPGDLLKALAKAQDSASTPKPEPPAS